MGQTGHIQFSRKYKVSRCSSADKTDSKGSNTNTYLIVNFPKTLVKK